MRLLTPFFFTPLIINDHLWLVYSYPNPGRLEVDVKDTRLSRPYSLHRRITIEPPDPAQDHSNNPNSHGIVEPPSHESRIWEQLMTKTKNMEPDTLTDIRTESQIEAKFEEITASSEKTIADIRTAKEAKVEAGKERDRIFYDWKGTPLTNGVGRGPEPTELKTARAVVTEKTSDHEIATRELHKLQDQVRTLKGRLPETSELHPAMQKFIDIKSYEI